MTESARAVLPAPVPTERDIRSAAVPPGKGTATGTGPKADIARREIARGAASTERNARAVLSAAALTERDIRSAVAPMEKGAVTGTGQRADTARQETARGIVSAGRNARAVLSAAVLTEKDIRSAAVPPGKGVRSASVRAGAPRSSTSSRTRESTV